MLGYIIATDAREAATFSKRNDRRCRNGGLSYEQKMWNLLLSPFLNGYQRRRQSGKRLSIFETDFVSGF